MANITQRNKYRPLFDLATAVITGAVLVLVATAARSADPVSSPAGPEGPEQIAYTPAKVPAPVVILLSGQTGPPNYQSYATEVAKLGYYAVLLDGKDILTPTQDGGSNLKKAITRAQGSPNALPGKVAVIAFSQGGGGALAHAMGMPDLISMVVAYYPATSWTKDLPGLVKRFKVPILVLAGERDTYNNNCCWIDSMHTMEKVAKENSLPFELVAYPQAGHGFNQPGSGFRADDSADAWRRTREKLNQYIPIPK